MRLPFVVITPGINRLDR